MVDGVKHKNQRVQFIEAALADTDARVEQDKGVAPSFLLACLLWHEVRERWQAARRRRRARGPALQQAIDAVFDARIGDISGRGKLGTDMREIWLMQPRFERRTGTTPYAADRATALPRRLRLPAPARRHAARSTTSSADWWEDFALGSGEEREALIAAAREAQRRDASRVTRGAARAATSRGRRASRAPRQRRLRLQPSGGSGDGAPARKRRRRRRKPAGSGAAAAAERRAPERAGQRWLATNESSSAWVPTSVTPWPPCAPRCARLSASAAHPLVVPRRSTAARPSMRTGPDYVNAVAELRTRAEPAGAADAAAGARAARSAASGRTATRRARSTSTC